MGVAGVSFGLGWVVANRQHVISTMRTTMAEEMAELRAGFRKDLELQLTRERARAAGIESELRSQIALAQAEAGHARSEAAMQGQLSLTWQRRVEDLEKRVSAGVVINSGGDTSIGRDVAGGNHEQTSHGSA